MLTKTFCPNCLAPMKITTMRDHAGASIEIDHCPECRLFWFDRAESIRLNPDSTIKLLQLINSYRNNKIFNLSDVLSCPRCYKKLSFAQDLVRSNKISYYRCEFKDGRLVSFYQFLREKQFVRSLSPLEIKQLPAEIKQLRCSSCGGMINLTTDTACPYCRAPISALDPKAVEKAINNLNNRERNKNEPKEPSKVIFPSEYQELIDKLTAPRQTFSVLDSGLVDLVMEGIEYLLKD